MDPLTQRLFMAASGGSPMTLVFDTSLSAGTTVGVPLRGLVDVTVDWGDGSSNAYSGLSGTYETHTYASGGVYTVRIYGRMTAFGGNVSRPGFEKLTRCTSFGNIGLSDFFNAFSNAVNLVEVPTSLPPGILLCRQMFSFLPNFNAPQLTQWDTSSIFTSRQMFLGCSSFNQNIGGWDMSGNTNMSSMFNSCTVFNQNIGGWDTSGVTDMSSMFILATAFNQNIGGWDTGLVGNMDGMFDGATAFNQYIGDWDTSSAQTMGAMFRNAAAFNQNISGWDMSSVANQGYGPSGVDRMFQGATAFNQDLSAVITGETVQPTDFSLGANATFANNANGLKPLLADGVTRINT